MGDSNLSIRTSVHKALGGGRVADLLLWRRWCGGAMMLVSATTMYYLFEIAGYNFLPFVANVLLLFVVILFFWAKSASLLNRPLPPIPDMEFLRELLEWFLMSYTDGLIVYWQLHMTLQLARI
ncbi:Reticulon-like protein B11 [Hibiscus syriacus]|uniref:Reticulon-like protein n=1 Tax=Hibiscus syriacus TaxID=106335 RepID=A0A6A2Y1U1_HIBSY|nr:Reticulon-like protein B11 [Hibiscus syriacus]